MIYLKLKNLNFDVTINNYLFLVNFGIYLKEITIKNSTIDIFIYGYTMYIIHVRATINYDSYIIMYNGHIKGFTTLRNISIRNYK